MNLNAYPELAENMRRVLAEHGWALRVAARKLGIGYSVLHNITSGVRAREGTLVRIAECIGEDPVQWLRWGGYAEVADSYARQADPRSAAASPDHGTREKGCRYCLTTPAVAVPRSRSSLGSGNDPPPSSMV